MKIKEHTKRNRKMAAYRDDLLEKHPYCAYCNRRLYWESATLDHVIPIGNGGPDHPSNAVLACKRCNERKGNRTVDEFRKADAAREGTK
jgi:5-methylcytosine-specific restriction endonuclease McrA